MNKLLKYSLFLLFTAFASCSSDDDGAPIVPNGHPQPGDALELTVSAADFVTDGAPDTRATDSGNTTTFKDGDRVGIIILDATNKPIYDNIPYVYNNGNWTFDSNNDEGKGGCYYDTNAETYIVYYPYSRAADRVNGLDELKGKLAPKFNQSNIEDYRASDLMVWTNNGHLASSVTTLNAELTHAFASIYLASPTINGVILDDDNNTPYISSYAPGRSDISDVNFTIDDAIYVPYQATDGSLQCILPAGFTTGDGDIRCFYTIGSKTYGNTISIPDAAANTRYVSRPEIKNVIYSLGNAHVGDFYCKNSKDKGYLIPGDVASLSTEQKNACIGIVCSTDVSRIGQAAKDVLTNTPHGLVMALTNASEDCRWGDDSIDENSGGAVRTPFKDNTLTLQQQYNNVDGYGETHWILNTYRSNGSTLQNTYTAFYHASRYGTAEGGTPQYAAPANTTDWFIPSMGQWWDILSNLGGIDLSVYRTDQREFISISGAASTAVDNMNRYLRNINGTTMFRTDTNFWSSSEYSIYNACAVVFYTIGPLDLCYYTKSNSRNSKVRCVFAF